MNTRKGRSPPRTLSDRISRLTDTLESLCDQVKEDIARAVSDAVADAVHDALTALLGRQARPPTQKQPMGFFEDDRWGEEQEDPWHDDNWRRHEDGWGRQEEDDPASHRPETTNRGRAAVGTALQAGLWWFRRQQSAKPLLTTLLVTLMAGVGAYLTGPTVTLTALASATGLLATAEGACSATTWLAGILGRLN